MEAEEYPSLLRRQRNCCCRCTGHRSWDIYEIFMGSRWDTSSGKAFGITTAISVPSRKRRPPSFEVSASVQ